jgi:hypothetical protein
MKTHFQETVEGLGAYAIPVITVRKQNQSPYLVGTGSLCRMGADVFLITAKHVVDELGDGLIMTSGRNGFIRFAADKAAFDYPKSTARDHDICVARIPAEALQNLHNDLRVVEPHQISAVQPYDKLTLYAFVGYPHSKNKPKPKSKFPEIILKPFYYVFRERVDINNLSSPGKVDELHAAFSAPLDKIKDVNLEREVQPPAPYGISGCGVWRLRLNATTGLVDDCSLVAVGIEYIKKHAAFVATKIHSPLAAIAQFEQILKK